MNNFNFITSISRELAIYSTIAFAGFIFIIKIFKNKKKINKKILKRNILLMLVRDKLYFVNLNKEFITFESKELDSYNLIDPKSDKLNKMQQYVQNLHTKCEMDKETADKKKTEEENLSSKNEKIFCYFLKNISQMITKKTNKD